MTRLEQMLAFLEQDPNDSFARYAVALEYISARDYKTALSYLDELRARDPHYLATYFQLGRLYEALDRADDAMAAYRTGITVGRSLGDMHTVSELQAALDDLESMG